MKIEDLEARFHTITAEDLEDSFRKAEEDVRHALPSEQVTWSAMVRIEPRLKVLLDDAAAMKDDGSGETYCANYRWYRCGLRDRLVRLAGWHAEKRELRSMWAYDLAYETVYNTLSDCRGQCSCM